MKPTFLVTEQSVRFGLEQTQRSFGIAMMEAGRIVDEVPDFTVQRNFAEQVAQALTRGQVSAVHFREILEDFAAEYGF